MIRLFKDYFDRNGVRYKVISFNDGVYACQSYSNGKCLYLKPNELFTSPPPKPTKVKFTDFIKEEDVKPIIKKNDEAPVKLISTCEEPVYEEPVYESFEDVQKVVPLKDNIKETADDDFYADF